MGRHRRISVDAKPTTISLTPTQKIALRKLQAKRFANTGVEPLLNELVLDGLRALLGEEGFSSAELAHIFPGVEIKKAKVQVFRKKRRS
jgi:hypothetical protein